MVILNKQIYKNHTCAWHISLLYTMFRLLHNANIWWLYAEHDECICKGSSKIWPLEFWAHWLPKTISSPKWIVCAKFGCSKPEWVYLKGPQKSQPHSPHLISRGNENIIKSSYFTFVFIYTDISGSGTFSEFTTGSQCVTDYVSKYRFVPSPSMHQINKTILHYCFCFQFFQDK